MTSVLFHVRFLVLIIILLALNACSGGSSAPDVVAPPAPPVSNTPTWSKGVFESETNFEDRCESPRTGINPATGSAYPDVAGSILHENHWLRSWSNDKYLWYDEIEDVDPATYTDPLGYFDILKTTATTPSGNPKDRFHFTYSTDEYQQLVSSGASAGYGAEYALISRSVPRELKIALVEPGSPAAAASVNLLRGAEILEVDGVDFVNNGTQEGVDTINAGLFPDSEGETHTFVVRDPGSTTTRTISMTSAIVTSAAVHQTSVVNTASGPVAYIVFNTFGIEDAEAQIIDAIQTVANAGVQDLVLDLRYNGGGFLDIAGQLGYMIAGSTQTSGKTFDRITFNDKYPSSNPVTGQALSPTPFHSTSLGFSVPTGQNLPALNLNRVFILSTSGTCSASEAVINGLRGANVEVVLIGSTTCGKPYGFYATDNCGTTYFTIQFKGSNDLGFGEYSDGFTPMNASGTVGELIPGCEVSDDFSHQLGDEQEALLETALYFRETGACPAAAAQTVSGKMTFSQMLGDHEHGSLYNSDRMRKHLLKKEILNQRK